MHWRTDIVSCSLICTFKAMKIKCLSSKLRQHVDRSKSELSMISAPPSQFCCSEQQFWLVWFGDCLYSFGLLLNCNGESKVFGT